jgi:hypothetical protein
LEEISSAEKTTRKFRKGREVARALTCKNSQFIRASSSLTWKNVFKLMLKIVELILQL